MPVRDQFHRKERAAGMIGLPVATIAAVTSACAATIGVVENRGIGDEFSQLKPWGALYYSIFAFNLVGRAQEKVLT